MRLYIALRASSVLWAAPFGLLLTLLYALDDSGVAGAQRYGYPPTLVTLALTSAYATTYALTSGLAAWEGGRIRQAGLWEMAPARSPYRVAAQALLPVLILAWLMLLLPVAIMLARAGSTPTPESLRPLGMAMIVVVAHAVLGFAVGCTRLPRLLTAPLMTVAVWVLVAFSWSSETIWLRHLLGQYPDVAMYGELVSLSAVTPHVLFTGSIAAAVAALWLRIPKGVGAKIAVSVRVAFVCCIAASGTLTACRMVDDWGRIPPTARTDIPMECLGDSPKVCMPRITAAKLPAAHDTIVSVLSDFREVGIKRTPSVIRDTLGDGRSPEPSNDDVWKLNITSAAKSGSLRLQLMRQIVRYPCSHPHFLTTRRVGLWSAHTIGGEKAYRKQMERERDPLPVNATSQEEYEEKLKELRQALAQLPEEVEEVLAEPPVEQGEWFRNSIRTACESGQK